VNRRVGWRRARRSVSTSGYTGTEGEQATEAG